MIHLQNLPGVDKVEALARLPALMKDEQQELEAAVEATSITLFGISLGETYYWPSPDYAAAKDEEAWEHHFEFLEFEYDEERSLWDAIGLNIQDDEGSDLACFPYFARQIICAVRSLHPRAKLHWLSGDKSDEQIQAEAEAWARRLMQGDRS